MRQTSKRRPARYVRALFFVDERAIRRARRILGVHTNGEAVRLAVDRVVEMEEFWRFMTRSRAGLERESIDIP